MSLKKQNLNQAAGTEQLTRNSLKNNKTVASGWKVSSDKPSELVGF